MVSSWEPVCAEASIPAEGYHRNHSEFPGDREPKLEKHSESADILKQPIAPQTATYNCNRVRIYGIHKQ